MSIPIVIETLLTKRESNVAIIEDQERCSMVQCMPYFPSKLKQQRAGLTLVELLVVIAIIALLAALIIPAIQRVRESHNRLQCANHLRQLYFGFSTYHNDHGSLPAGLYGPVAASGPITPPGTTSSDINRGPWVSGLYTILPYIEQDSVYRGVFDTKQTFPVTAGAFTPSPIMKLNLKEEKQAWWVNFTQTLPASSRRIPILQCPSDDLYEEVDYVFLTVSDPIGNALPTPYYIEYKQEALALGRTNYVGVSGKLGSASGNYIGIFTNRSSTKFGSVTVADGTSNTLFYGEALGGTRDMIATHGQKTPRFSAMSWLGCGILPTGGGIQGKINQPSPYSPALWVYDQISFGSRHPQGANFCFADGSVRLLKFTSSSDWPFLIGEMPTLPQNSSWGILQQLAGWKDGGTLDASSVIND